MHGNHATAATRVYVWPGPLITGYVCDQPGAVHALLQHGYSIIIASRLISETPQGPKTICKRFPLLKMFYLR